MIIPENITTVVTDMDGTLYLSDKPIEGAADAIKRLRRNRRVLFLTNNSSVSGLKYVEKLNKLGIPASREDIITSGDAALNFIKRMYPDLRIYVVGTEEFIGTVKETNLIIDEQNADLVLVAFDTELTYKKLEKACDLIRSGAVYVATHPDLRCPKIGGYKPDVGSYIALIAACTERHPDFICGKPEKIMADYLTAFCRARPDEIMMVGDRLYTDMDFASESGFASCLVLSGETSRESVDRQRKKPDFIIGSIAELEI